MRNTTSLLALIAQHMGVILLPELLSRSVAGDQLNILLLEDQRIVRSLSVITPPRHH